MDATQMAAFLQSFQDMAKANKDLVEEMKVGRQGAANATDTTTAALARTSTAEGNTEQAGAIAITNMKVLLDMGCVRKSA